MVIGLTNKRNAPAVSAQSDVVFLTWRIVEDAQGERSVLGLMGLHTVRLTSPIQSVDVATRIVVTGSGRRYHLQQAPTTDPIVIAAMMLHALTQRVVVTRDVSDEIWSEMAGVTPQ